MTDDFDTHVTAALRTLERDPVDDGRESVARRVRRRRVHGVAGAAALALVVGIGIGAVVANNDSSRKVDVQQPGPSGPTAPPISAAATGVLTWPTTVAPGDEFAAVLRNPLPDANTSCFLTVRLERWDGNAWVGEGDLFPEGVDPNLAGPGASCQPDLIQPGAFIGERTYKIPADVPPGNYRLVEVSTEGEGRLTIIGPNQVAASLPRPVSHESIDLAAGGGLGEVTTNLQLIKLNSAVVLNDDRLAIEWDTQCNEPALRVDFDYDSDHVTARLVVGGFSVVDCVGEQEIWSTVVDLPAPLWGRDVDVQAGEDSERARRVDVTPRRTYVLPETEPGAGSPPVVSTSIFRQEQTSDSTQVSVYGGACVTDAQSAVYTDGDGTIYVQPHVQVDPAGDPARCGPWQSIDIPVWFSPAREYFGPNP